MSTTIKQLAIIGPTASGKSDLAIKIAQEIDAYILSIDSLSIYKEIDIVSAKPSKEELGLIKHFGINTLCADEHFSVDIFIDLYKEVLLESQKDKKNLIIVGGTSFYLKSLLEGLSQLPPIDKSVEQRVRLRLQNLPEAYTFLHSLDAPYMQKIAKSDRYRIEKALLIYEASGLSPSLWFAKNPPKPIIEHLDIFNIETPRELLRERIHKRTAKMLALGLIDEICYLEQRYGRLPNAMKSIGVVEVLEYLDAKLSKEQMIEDISTHTAQLAKRQETFNRSQFRNITHAPLDQLEAIILKSLQ